MALCLSSSTINAAPDTSVASKNGTQTYELVAVVMEAQDRFEAQIELQKLYAHTRLYLPADYTED